MIVGNEGAPLFFDIAAANIHDSQLLEPIISLLKISQKTRILASDVSFDSKQLKSICAKKNIALLMSSNPCRNGAKSDYWPYRRWMIARTCGWLR